MLPNSMLQIVGMPCIIAPVRASQHVSPERHDLIMPEQAPVSSHTCSPRSFRAKSRNDMCTLSVSRLRSKRTGVGIREAVKNSAIPPNPFQKVPTSPTRRYEENTTELQYLM